VLIASLFPVPAPIPFNCGFRGGEEEKPPNPEDYLLVEAWINGGIEAEIEAGVEIEVDFVSQPETGEEMHTRLSIVPGRSNKQTNKQKQHSPVCIRRISAMSKESRKIDTYANVYIYIER